MTGQEQRNAAKKFAADWKGRGYEKGESQAFWMTLLHDVFGVSEPAKFISFEDRVHLDHTSFIDGFIPSTHVLIEQKGIGKALLKPIKQSDGTFLTPFQQAKRYSAELPYSNRPRYIVSCNFETFMVYDMENPTGEPEIIQLADLPKEYYRLSFLTDSGNSHLKREMELSIKAGEIVGLLYDEILKHYNDPKAESTLKSLNMLCVRLVFCLYAEDAGIFGYKNQFHDYLSQFEPRFLRQSLIDLFKVLDTKTEDRDPYLTPELAAFPYVNGGLFADENIEIPLLDEKVKRLLLAKASDDFDWSEISPTIFGAVFESTLNPETRRSGGMHYTSIENIHKVIDPLFLDELKAEFEEIKKQKQINVRTKNLQAFQKKLAGLNFLDPACGSGNFLTETYLSIRHMENEILELLNSTGHIDFTYNPIQISISQFYGIEVNDFAVSVAKTALWIAESQMMKETEDIVRMNLDFLPLKSYANITESNALRMDWNDVIPKEKLNYVMGNPPFVGKKEQTRSQKAEIVSLFGKKCKGIGNLDYVSGWYAKAAQLIQGTNIRCAFVSTNSITQGEQAAILWKPLFEIGVHIDFAHRTFRWDSEASIKAHVHCVIVGFSVGQIEQIRQIFDKTENTITAKNISPYLIDAPNIFVESRSTAINAPKQILYGNVPIDWGTLILSKEEKDFLCNEYPQITQYIKFCIGGDEFLNNKKRWCLWLVNVSPAEIRTMPDIMERIALCKEKRLQSSDAATRSLAERPSQFRDLNNPESAILIPKVSSEKRVYIPIGFIDKQSIPVGTVLIVPNGDLLDFGVLTSSVHMAWMRAVCGRLETRYQYSKDIVYNNFPWCEPTDKQKEEIEQTAQAILDTRTLYPDCSLADLYDDTTMPPELRKAHQANDRAVMKAYGFAPTMTEPEIVAELMKRYQELTRKGKKQCK